MRVHFIKWLILIQILSDLTYGWIVLPSQEIHLTLLKWEASGFEASSILGFQMANSETEKSQIIVCKSFLGWDRKKEKKKNFSGYQLTCPLKMFKNIFLYIFLEILWFIEYVHYSLMNTVCLANFWLFGIFWIIWK